MVLFNLSDRLPHCSRCRGDLVISSVAPQNDAYGRPIHLELCAACDAGDAGRPAAGILLQFIVEGGGQDASRSQEAAQLVMEWTKECMAAHGWYWQENPPDQP
ncbi:DUF6300 family protein [Streptomyces noursei]|uniref:Uncharacterized protein n=1 Tax=Streptomyces noursei TaxID=1971 RepID=A0A2N8PQZ4_STRNR|nr:DUF6300 family protein [Streptomyces noursei]PNE43448.1 hypothetical protein AOB60_00505 [Streptomyces noursei]